MAESSTSGISIYSDTTGISYEIPYEYLVFNLLPKRYRKIKLFKYILSITYSLYKFWNYNFLPYREQSLREVRINSQTIVLQKWLNYTFGRTDIEIINTSYLFQLTYIYRKGEIGDASNLNAYIYRKGEANPTEQVYTYTKAEVVVDADFIVRVPQALLSQGVTQQQIRAIVDKYVALGVIYKIEVI